MTLEKLKKYCLQYLEQSDDLEIMSQDIDSLESNDIYAEYLLNIDHSILMGLVRYATSLILPLCEKEVTTNPFYLTEDGTANGYKLFHKIKEMYAIDENGELLSNVKYTFIGNKCFIKDYKSNYTYFCVYHPTIYELSHYVGAKKAQGVTEENNLDLARDLNGNGLNIPDEMAINLKYLVYSDMKLEESSSIANANKNYFESYLAEMQAVQVQNNQVEIVTRDWGDTYGDENKGDTVSEYYAIFGSDNE